VNIIFLNFLRVVFDLLTACFYDSTRKEESVGIIKATQDAALATQLMPKLI